MPESLTIELEARLREDEDRRAFLLTLSDARRPLGDPDEVRRAATPMIGVHHGARRHWTGREIALLQEAAERARAATALRDAQTRQAFLFDLGDALHPLDDSAAIEAAVRLVGDGPCARARSLAAESLGMTLHELTTNALEYGVIEVPGGRPDVRWQTHIR